MECDQRLKTIALNLITKKNIEPEIINSMGCQFTVIRHKDNSKNIISVSLWKSNPGYVYNLSTSLLSWKALRSKYWNDFKLRIYTDISVFLPFDNLDMDKYISQIITFLLLLKYINENDISKYLKYPKYQNIISSLDSILKLKLIDIKDAQMINKIDKNDIDLFKKFLQNLPSDMPRDFLIYISNNNKNIFNNFFNNEGVNGQLLYISFVEFLRKHPKYNNTYKKIIINELFNSLGTVKDLFTSIIEENNKLVSYKPLVTKMTENFNNMFKTDITNMEYLLKLNANEDILGQFITLIKKFQQYIYNNLYNENLSTFTEILYNEIKKNDVEWTDIFRQLTKDPQIEIWLYSCYWGQKKEGNEKYRCLHKKTFGSMMRYQPIFDTSIDICVVRNLELLTSEHDRKYYEQWMKSGLTIFRYTFDYTCNVYQSVEKICNEKLANEKMMLSTFNINKKTSWFRKNNVASNMYECIINLFNINAGVKKKSISNDKFKNYIVDISSNLPKPFYDFSYGVDEIILTICLKSQLLLNLVNTSIFSIDVLAKCQDFVVFLGGRINIEKNFEHMGININNNGVEYDINTLVRINGYFNLEGEKKSKNIFNNNYVSIINMNIFNNFLRRNNYKVEYNTFIDYLNGISTSENNIKIFEEFKTYLKDTLRYTIPISENYDYLKYINENGTGLNAIKTDSFNEFVKYITNKLDTVFPAHAHKNKKGNLTKQEIRNSSKFYLENNEFYDENKINNYLEKQKETKNFYQKYQKYKFKYLSFKYSLPNNTFY